MDPQLDDKDPFAASGAAAPDLSAYDDPLPDLGGNDAETVKRINRRTSPLGRVIGLMLIVGSSGLAYWAYQSSISYDTRMTALEAAGKLPPGEMLPALREVYAATSHDDVRERVLLNLGAYRDTSSIPLMIQALDRAGIVRRAAARALAHIGLPAAEGAKAKLLAVLPSSDARDRPQVVWALAVLKEGAAVPEILREFAAGHLQNLQNLDKKPAFDPKVIIEAVGVEKLASDELLTSKDKAIRTLVANALAEAASPQVVDPLIKLLQDEDTEVVRAAAAGLGRTGDPRAAQPLFDLLGRKPSLRQSVLDAIGRSTSAPGIAKLIDQAQSVDLKRSLVSALADTHDPRVADSLAKFVADPDADIKQTAAGALAQYGDVRAIPALLELAKSEDRTTALDALDSLAMVGKPEVGDALVPMLKDNPGRKASILKAIGKSGSTSAAAAIVKELDGDDVEAAAFALADLKYAAAYPRLLASVKRPPNVDFSKPSVPTEEVVRNREIAMRALGRFGKPDAIPALITVIEDPTDSTKLRAVAGSVLGQLATPETVGQIIAKAKADGLDEATRAYLVQGLWQADIQSVSGQLAELLQPSVPAEVRRSAALALGYAADPANDQVLLDLLRNAEVKREAAFAVILGGSPAAAEELYRQISSDRELREALQDVLMADDTDFFAVLTARQFANGQIFRRLSVAEALKNGKGELTFSYPYQQVTKVLKSGWSGPSGLTPRDVRERLYAALRGQDGPQRMLAAEALGAIGERGLLLASRDEAGPGQSEAREVLMRQNRGG